MKRALALTVAGSCSLLALAVALPAPSSAQRGSLPFTPASQNVRSIGSFTPAVQDPRLAASLTNGRSIGGEGVFRFTPAGAAGGRDRQVRVAVRVRPGLAPPVSAERSGIATTGATVQTPATPAVMPSSYNLGTSVGWRRFAVTGEVENQNGGSIVPGTRESARVGVDYRVNRRLTGRAQVGSERAEGVQRVVGDDRAYNFDVGGSYSITRNIDVTGGMRYRVSRDRLEPLARDERRDSQAVYIGTAFRF